MEALPDLYDEMLKADGEHVDVSVMDDDSGWSISAFRGGKVVMEKLGTRGVTARHMNDFLGTRTDIVDTID